MEARAKVMPGRRKKPLPAWIVIGLFLFLLSPTNTEGIVDHSVIDLKYAGLLPHSTSAQHLCQVLQR